MSAHYRKIKPRHRYNEREEQMRVAMMLRRSWARFRRNLAKRKREYIRVFEGFTFPGATVEKVDTGVYVFEWRNDPLDTSGEKG